MVQDLAPAERERGLQEAEEQDAEHEQREQRLEIGLPGAARRGRLSEAPEARTRLGRVPTVNAAEHGGAGRRYFVMSSPA